MFWFLLGLAVIAQPLSFQDALARANQNPEVLSLARARGERAAFRKHMSRLTYNPVLQLQPGVRDMYNGGTGGELYVTLMQRFSTAGLGKKRERTVDLELAHDEAERALRLREVRRHVAGAWLQRWAAQQALELTRAEVEAAHAFEKQLELSLAAGEATRIELGQARSFCAELELVLLAQEGKTFESGIELARSLGEVVEGPRGVLVDLPQVDLPEAVEKELAQSSVDRTPEVVAARALVQTERARLEEVKAARAPSFAVGVMGWREGGGDVAGVLTLEAEIPAFDRGERERATQAAQASRVKGHEQRALVNESADRLLVLHDIEHTRAVAASYEHGLVASLEEVAVAQKTRLDAHEGTVFEWVLSRRALLDAKMRSIDAQAAQALARFLASEWFRLVEGNAP